LAKGLRQALKSQTQTWVWHCIHMSKEWGAWWAVVVWGPNWVAGMCAPGQAPRFNHSHTHGWNRRGILATTCQSKEWAVAEWGLWQVAGMCVCTWAGAQVFNQGGHLVGCVLRGFLSGG
jgi:hypothetical protein